MIGEDLGRDEEDVGNTLEISAAQRIHDIFMVCSNTNSQVSSLIELVKVLCTRMTNIETRLSTVESALGRANAIIGSVIPDENGDDMAPARDGQNTAKIKTDVMYAVIRSIWQQENKTVIPIGKPYLSRVCSACFPDLAKGQQSDLGILLSHQIGTIDTDLNSGSNIVLTLTSSNNTLNAAMLHAMLIVIKLLGTVYAFMLPIELSQLLNRVVLFRDNGVQLRDTIDESAMVRPRGGYNVAKKMFEATSTTKALAKMVNLGNKKSDAKRLCTAVEQSLVGADGTLQGTPSKAKPSQFSTLFQHRNMQSDTTPTTSSGTNAQCAVTLDDMMTPRKADKG